MKIGVVVHGPNIIDSGYALKLTKTWQNFIQMVKNIQEYRIIKNSLEYYYTAH